MNIEFGDYVAYLDNGRPRTGTVVITPSNYDHYNAQHLHDPAVYRHTSISDKVYEEFLFNDEIPSPGTVIVSRQAKKGRLYLVPTSVLKVFYRRLHVGGCVVKRNRPVQRGIVTDIETTCDVEVAAHIGHPSFTTAVPAIIDPEHAPVPTVLNSVRQVGIVRGVSLSHLQCSRQYDLGRPVLYQGWFGIITLINYQYAVRLVNNSVVTLAADVILKHSRSGEPLDNLTETSLGMLVQVRKADMRLGHWVFGEYNPNVPPYGVIVAERAVSMHVKWDSHKDDLKSLQKPHSPATHLGLDEFESPDFTYYHDLAFGSGHYSGVAGVAKAKDHALHPRLDPRVSMKFVDVEQARSEYRETHDSERLFENTRDHNLGIDMNLYTIHRASSSIRVLWQDGTITQEPDMDLSPVDLPAGEFLPGDIICTRAVQPLTENPTAGFADRPAGIGIVQAMDPQECLVMVKWFPDANVCIHVQEGQFDLADDRFTLGKISTNVEAVSAYDIMPLEPLQLRMLDYVHVRADRPLQARVNFSLDLDITWVGHVVEVGLDGTFTVVLGAAKPPVAVRASRDDLHLLLDFDLADPDAIMEDSDQDHDHDHDHDEESGSDETEQSMNGDVGTIMMGDRRETTDYIMDDGEILHKASVDSDVEEWTTDEDEGDGSGQPQHADISAATESQAARNEERPPPSANDGSATAQYMLLSPDELDWHKFAAEAEASAPGNLRKILKEHKILSTASSMPSGMYVRSWDSRVNLLRALILGPSDTPYAGCPFIFDIFLPDSYPNHPPKLFFHHMSTANYGDDPRINPNLYDDGKVCLSLLGTYPGRSANEGWVPGKSTLLQVLVSIQSLILVPRPFYSMWYHLFSILLIERLTMHRYR